MNNEHYNSSFLVPDFVEIQRKSFFHLLEKGILEEFCKVNPIVSEISQLKVTFYPEKFLLILPDLSVSEAILQGKTYSCKLYVPATLTPQTGAVKSGLDSSWEKRPLNSPPLKRTVPYDLNDLKLAFFPVAKEGGNLRKHDMAGSKAASLSERITSNATEALKSPAKQDQRFTCNVLPPDNTYATFSKENLRHENGVELGMVMPKNPASRTSSKKLGAINPWLHRFSKENLTSGHLISWVLLANLPLMTKRGHFIINGSPRVLVNQLTRCPGIYFHERRWGLGKTERRVVYADFVSRRGAWLRLQADKAGEVWARLKRTPKIPFSLFYNSMVACERNPSQWSPLDQDTLIELYEEVNPTKREASAQSGKVFLEQKFKNPRSYDLGSTGRDQLNMKFGESVVSQQLTSKDLYCAFEQIKELQNHRIFADDIDNLSNRRVRAAGDLVQGQIETGVYRLEKAVIAKMRNPSPDVSCQTLLTTKSLNGALREFFGSSPLSQYMDQTNPLAEITQKRRISSLGPGGISRETAGMAIRGIHPTHYGRICPIETPEGKNAGLVNSLTVFTQIRKDGTLESPYYPILQGQVQNELGFKFLAVETEERHALKIAPGDVNTTASRFLPSNSFPIREAGNPQEDFRHASRETVNYMAVSPIQMISIATSLIPFLEHDDANRALMGSNMQRQAVPLLQAERPVVGTGLEALVIASSGHALQSHASGYISFVSNEKVIILGSSSPVDPLSLISNDIDFLKKNTAYINMSHYFLSPWKDVMFSINKLKEVMYNLDQLQYNKLGSLRDPEPKGPLKSLLPWAPWVHRFSKENLTTASLYRVPWQGPSKTLSNSKNSKVGSKRILVKTNGTREKGTGKRFCPQSLKSRDSFKSDFFFTSLLPLRALYQPFSIAKLCDASSLMHSWEKGDSLEIFGSFASKTTTGHLKTIIYPLQSYCRSNQETCLNHVPAVAEGEWIQEGDLIADCSASQLGELALGKNVLIAYLPWEGYNFEDAVVISERLVLEDVYTSIHIQKYEVETKETKFGFERITREVPGLLEPQRRRLDKHGIVKIGSWVREGDILVGKASPKGLQPLSPYERLAYDIANVEAATMEDTSLRVPKGVEGRVINYHVYNDVSFLMQPHHQTISSFTLPSKQSNGIHQFIDGSDENDRSDESNEKDVTGSLNRVRIYLAEERRIQVGDKVAGRHGNKGIVSTILPRQDMPYLPDGQIIDVVLNPLGIPSRMNVGQVFECLLGLAGMQLGQHFQVTPFDEVYGAEASRSLVYLKLYQARLRRNQNWIFNFKFPGKVALFDGRTGQLFDQWVTVGYAYMLKLVHLVDEKIHARSTGPYSLVTKQPLGGRSKHGGQRLGEMEVWALEGFGAAYILQEMLTSKSDDVVGREQAVEAILFKGKMSLGNPEAFKVLVRELQSLCLDVGVYAISSERLDRQVIDVGSIL